MSSLPAQVLAQSPTLARLNATNSKPVNISDASTQWATRPAEERFWSLDDAAAASLAISNRLSLHDVNPDGFTVAPHPTTGSPQVQNLSTGGMSDLSPLAFQQLARFSGAPAAYLQTLPGEIAAKALAHGWEHNRPKDRIRLQVLNKQTPSVQIRAITSPTHDLTPNFQLLNALADVVKRGDGWKVPPGRKSPADTGPSRIATQADCLAHAGHSSLAVRPGDEISPSGVYVSDRDCFALLVDDSPRGHIDADGGLSRFVQVSNSEVGMGALEITTGWLRSVCGNHILWGCQDVATIRAIHRGDNASRSVRRIHHQIVTRAWGEGRQEMEAQLNAAKLCQIANTKEELIALLFGKKKIATKEHAALAWDVNCELSNIDGNPGSAWGVANALTRLSQVQHYTADRNRLDASAAKVAELVSVR